MHSENNRSEFIQSGKCARILPCWKLFIVVFLYTTVGLSSLGIADDHINEELTNSQADSLRNRQDILPARTAWEEALYFPGRIVYFPFKWTLKGTGELVGYVDDTKIIQKIDDRLESDDGRRKLQFTYNSRTGGGTKYFQRGIGSDRIDRNIGTLTATTGISDEQLYRATLEDINILGSSVDTDFMVQYQKLTEESFYGFGMSSLKSSESGYTLEQTTSEARIGYSTHPNLHLNLTAGYERTNIAKGHESGVPSTIDVYNETTLPGVDSSVEMVHSNLALSFDSRDSEGNPTRGSEIMLTTGISSQSNDNRFGYLKHEVDASKYFHLFYDRVLVVRLATMIVKPFENRSVPFYELSEIGEEGTIRGYKRGRFTDRDRLITSLEYRYPIWHFWDEKGLDAVIFADFGQVSANIVKNGRIDDFRSGYGFGFRLWDWEDGLVARLQVGWSDDGARIYLGLN